jgi:hypothetical protein
MKKLTRQEIAAKEDLLIWAHGRKKANITTAIRSLKESALKDHPDIQKAIQVLQEERKRLNAINPLE